MPLPEEPWLAALRLAAEVHGQPAIGARISYSAAVVSAVLSGTYKGSLSRVQSAVEGVLLGAQVQCPVAGDLPRQRCVEFQRRGFAATNPLRVAMSTACPTCPNRSQS